MNMISYGAYRVSECTVTLRGGKQRNIPAKTYEVHGHPEMLDVSLSTGSDIATYDIPATEFERLKTEGLAVKV